MSASDGPGTLRLEPLGGPSTEPVAIEEGSPVTIGRAGDCAISLVDPSVSRDHLSLTGRDGRWFVTDLGSRHGTYLNGIRLPPRDPMPAASGDLLRIGPYTYRVQVGENRPSSHTIATREDSGAAYGRVERVSQDELESLARRRLDLLIDGASGIHEATTEEALASAILDLALAGSGYRRAAWVRKVEPIERVEVLSARDLDRGEAGEIVLSRSLLREALSGHVARLSPDAPGAYGESIVMLDIHSALCAPIMLDATVVGCLYLDSRRDEQTAFTEAVGFCHAVCRLAGLALSNLKRAELQARQGRLDRDLQVARNAQAFLLPPTEGVVADLRYAMSSRPGRIVAGDFFDVFAVDGGRVAICCGDVCGQGFGSAVLMIALLAHLRASLVGSGDAATAMNSVNRYITERSAVDMFASMWVAVWDPERRELQHVDAGHGHWMVCAAGAPPRPAGRPGGLLVGIDSGHCYTCTTLALEPGDRVVVYSDGIVEARDDAREQFGEDRLAEAVASSDTPATDVAVVLAALERFAGTADVDDDTTLASLQVMEPGRPPG